MLFGRRFGGYNNMMMNNCCQCQNECEREIVEPTINKCVEKEFYHEVPHVSPFMYDYTK